MTPEEMQERILQLEEENKGLTAERDTLLENNKTLTDDIQRVRAVNQRYFEKLSMQEGSQNDDEDEEETAPSCEEFAKTIQL